MKLFRVNIDKGNDYKSYLVLAESIEQVGEHFEGATGIYLEADTEAQGNASKLVVLKKNEEQKSSHKASGGTLDNSIY